MRAARSVSLRSRFVSFQRWALRAAFLIAVVVLPSSASAQTSYTAALDGSLPVTDVSPVSLSGGDASVGGSEDADAVLKGEAHAAAAAPNALVSVFKEFGGQALGHHDDIIISGPVGPVAVKLHLPFQAIFRAEWQQLGDGVNVFSSGVNQNAVVIGTLTAPGFGIASGMFDLEALNRAQDYIDLRFPVLSNAEIVPLPGNPGAVSIDLWGFLKQASRQEAGFAIGGYTGFSFIETDELRGEIILSLTVPLDVPLTLDLNLQQRSKADSFYYAGANGSLDHEAFGVPQDGAPVFELPDGYTSNSPSLGIVNNVVAGDSLKCPQPKDYWKTNPGLWPSSALTLGAQTYTAAELMIILKTPAKADASLILAYQLIAAKLNVANGSDLAPVAARINTADGLLSGFSGKLPYNVKPSSASGKLLTAAAALLESYNLLQLTPNCHP